jgi:hypothetical protein
MAAGYAALTTKDQVNQTIGRIAVQLRELFDAVEQFNAFFQARGATGLETEFGFASADANLIGTVNNDFEQLRQIYLGAQALASAKDFRAFSDDVEGLR